MTTLTYNHPDWGRCRGRVIRGGPDGRVLVQDLAENGAREWIDPEWVERPEITKEARMALRERYAAVLGGTEQLLVVLIDALDAAEETAADGLRMVGAFVVETDEALQERARARYAATPGPVHDLVTMAQEVERYRARDAALREAAQALLDVRLDLDDDPHGKALQAALDLDRRES